MTFSVLTPAQGAILRNRIGDTDTDDPKLTDTLLDALYTTAGSDLDLATVGALQELVGIYAMQVNIGGASQVSEQRIQRQEKLVDLRDYWETKTGTAGGKLSIGKIKHNINTKLADLDGS